MSSEPEVTKEGEDIWSEAESKAEEARREHGPRAAEEIFVPPVKQSAILSEEAMRVVRERLVREKKRVDELKILNANTFKQFLQRVLDYRVKDICRDRGIWGMRVVEYIVFGRKLLKDVYRDIIADIANKNIVLSPEEMNERLNMIFKYHEEFDARRHGLDRDVMKDIEESVIYIVRNIPLLEEKWRAIMELKRDAIEKGMAVVAEQVRKVLAGVVGRGVSED